MSREDQHICGSGVGAWSEHEQQDVPKGQSHHRVLLSCACKCLRVRGTCQGRDGPDRALPFFPPLHYCISVRSSSFDGKVKRNKGERQEREVIDAGNAQTKGQLKRPSAALGKYEHGQAAFPRWVQPAGGVCAARRHPSWY